jgi:hypothetical protein
LNNGLAQKRQGAKNCKELQVLGTGADVVRAQPGAGTPLSASERGRPAFRVIESIWGHRAGNPAAGNPEDDAFIQAALKELLEAE